MSVLALAFFSDLQVTLRGRLLTTGRLLLAAASVEPQPAIPRGKPHLLRDAGLVIHDAGLDAVRADAGWRELAGRDAVYRSHLLL